MLPFLLHQGWLPACFCRRRSVRLYSVGHPGGARSDRLLYQARLALDEKSRLKVVKRCLLSGLVRIFLIHIQLSSYGGLEGARVRNCIER